MNELIPLQLPQFENERFAFYLVGNCQAMSIFDKRLHRSTIISIDDLEEGIKAVKERKKQHGRKDDGNDRLYVQSTTG